MLSVRARALHFIPPYSTHSLVIRVLFVNDGLPVASFKSISRVGGGDWWYD